MSKKGNLTGAVALLDQEMAALVESVLAWSVSKQEGSDFEPKAFAGGFIAGVFECFGYLNQQVNPNDGSAFSRNLDQFLYVASLKDQLEKQGAFRE